MLKITGALSSVLLAEALHASSVLSPDAVDPASQQPVPEAVGDGLAAETDEDDVEEDNVLKIEIVMGGDPGVGKTTIATAWSFEEGREGHPPPPQTTISNTFTLPTKVDDGPHQDAELVVYDIAGADASADGNQAMAGLLRRARAVVLVFDATRPDTFGNILKWKAEFEAHTDEDVQWTLFQNKVDELERLGPRKDNHPF